MTDYFNTEKLHSVVAHADRNKAIFLAKLSPLHDYGFAVFESSSDKQVWVPCTVSEERYALSDHYKITLAPMLKGFGLQHFYQMDLTSLVQASRVLVLDQSIAWQDQVPRTPGLSPAKGFAKVKDALVRRIQSWALLPNLLR